MDLDDAYPVRVRRIVPWLISALLNLKPALRL
jgi:hypothetical protein